MAETYYLRWPEGRGIFDEGDPDRSPTGSTETFRPGRVIEVEDLDLRDHYVDRGWEEVPPEEAADAEEPDSAKLDPDAFFNRGYEDRVAAVEDGLVDHFLQRVYDEDGSVNVTEAVEARAATIGAELEGGGDGEDETSGDGGGG